MKNTGKPSEDKFERHIASFGKKAFLHRFVDAAEIRGRTGKIGQARTAPSDYMLVLDGETSFAEVKSTVHSTSFQFSLLRTTQSADATRILAAGGTYKVFIHAIEPDLWFCVPYGVLKGHPKRSMTWDELSPWRYDIEPVL